MAITLYDLSVPTFLQTTRAVSGCLARAASHCVETGGGHFGYRVLTEAVQMTLRSKIEKSSPDDTAYQINVPPPHL